MKHLLLAFALSVAACSSSASNSNDNNGQTHNNGETGQTTATTGQTTSTNGPEEFVIALDGDPNGLWWDSAAARLYIADDNGNRILSWTDADGISVAATLPTAAENGPGLGQLVRLDDGTIVVTRFGFGTAGDVAMVAPDGTAAVVPNLAVERRRIGLTVDNDGNLYSSWFVRLASGDRVGGVGALDLAGSETEVMTGFLKPVGVLAVGEHIYISDQEAGQVLRAEIDDMDAREVIATVDSPDLLTAGPDGALFIGSAGGSVLRVNADGSTEVVRSGFQAVRGVAWDEANSRLFVADHDPDEEDGITHQIVVIPYAP